MLDMYQRLIESARTSGFQFRNMFFWLLVVALFFVPHTRALDPVSIGLGIGSIGAGYWGFDFLKDQTYCRINECCNKKYIPARISDLEQDLRNKLYGQHIAMNQVVAALRAHFSKYNKPKKPLVMSFHGTPGTGKTYVADMIANALYKNGLKSKYVHKYMGRADFPLASEVNLYKARLASEVREAIADCPQSLFIFDEVSKMPPGIFESLASLLDYQNAGNENNRAIFIFLCNTAGVQISDYLGNLIKSGTLRENTKWGDFEQVMATATYNMDGGMQKTSLIEAHLIDHYFPFLPLEKKHVIKCLETEYWRWGKSPDKAEIERIVRDVITYDRTHGLFATSGCKTLDKKVAVEVMRSRM